MLNQIIGYRLSPQQKRVWSLQQDGSTYSARCAILLEGSLSVSFLEKALQAVIERHQILRTTLQCPSEIKIPIQVITDSSRVLWREVDLTGLDAQAQEAAVEKLFEEKHLNLEQGPLRHALLVVLSTRRHCLLLSLPTVCADAWTLKNLVREISLAYTACAEGRELTDEPLQYVQFSEWQNELVADEDAEEGKEYWRQQLIPELLSSSLPFESNTQGQSIFESHALSLAFPAETVAAIDSLALRHETTAEALLLACWQTLLWRLTGQREVVVGTAFESRPYEELHDALGLFARWLPINAAFDKHISFREALKRARESMLNASNWQDYFSWDLLAQNDAIGFFPFGFEYAKAAEKYQSASLAFSIYKQDVTVERFKVKLCCTEGKGVLHVELQYDAKLYRPAAMQRLAGEYQRLLESALGHPEVEISKLAWLGETEERELRCEWNQTSAAMPASCLHQLFEGQVERCAEAIAVVSEEEQLSYGELNQRANQLAHHLGRLGVGPEVLVGVLLERSVELVVALLGVLKAGGAYVPLDPGYPEERLSFMLAESGAPVLLTQEALLGRVPESKAQVLCLDRDWAAIREEQEENPRPAVRPENLVYVIYTSGSTGVPKGVMLSHQNLVNYLCWANEHYGLSGGGGGAPLHSSISFDLSVTSLFGPLLAGERVELLREAEGLEALVAALSGAVGTSPGDAYSLLKVTPAHLQALSYRLGSEGVELVREVKVIVIGGEALPYEALRYWRGRGVRLINEYGPTETAVGCCIYEVGAADEQEWLKDVPIGRPLANTQIYILNARLQPLPIGATGDLYIGGHGLARGYLSKAELTAESFIPNPFSSSEVGARLYRTGDLARYLPDGNIEFLGRADQQVKVRGFRIELGEIEAALRECANVREAIVVAREEVNERRLVAYLTGESEPIAVDDLRRHLQKKLPEYMVPSAFVVLSEMPLLPNGKVNRRALANLDEVTPVSTRPFVAPRTPIEEELAEVWRELLKVKKVGIYDHFLELGGNSLLITQLASRIQKKFQMNISLRSLFKSPTIAEMTKAILMQQVEQMDKAKLAGMLETLTELSPDEMKNILEAAAAHPLDQVS